MSKVNARVEPMGRLVPGIWENGVKIADEMIEDEDGVPTVVRHTYLMTPEEEAEDAEAEAEFERGEGIPGDVVLARLRRIDNSPPER